MLNIVGNKKIYFAISGILVGAALVAIVLCGFREGIDFSGGTLWQFKITSSTPAISQLGQVFEATLHIKDAQLNYDISSGSFLARFGDVGEASHQKFLSALQENYPSFEEISFSSIGPSVGNNLRKNAIIAIILVLVGISLYIAFAFRKASYPVSSWKYGWITLLTLFHDVVIPAGLLAYLGYSRGVEIDGNFVVALLVVMGFSVHDTIVVFDRIRENLVVNPIRGGKGKDFATVVNESVNQTMARSINTSLTLVLVLLALYFAGPLNLHYFVLTLLVGVIMGIYSSIFIASPALVVMRGKH
jgi:preprotein translocase subunit SecF